MTSREFGNFLKERREEKKVTLGDISAFTRINPNFLEAIERGDLSVLPQTYIRAFLREYASSVDLNEDDVLRMYDETAQKKSPTTSSRPAEITVEPSTQKQAPRSDPLTPLIHAMRPYVFGAILVIVAGSAYLLLRDGSAVTLTTQGEIPFDRVIRETEAAIPADTHRTYVATRPAPASPVRSTTDSLTLEMSTTDSLWLSIRIDNSFNEEYLFAPNRRRAWRAESTFVLTMGNAGGATFRLNGIDLGSLGRPGAVLRNRVISSALLR